VDGRIVRAAHQLFLERGLAGASIEEIAKLACAGKPSIYARFPSKEALFTAVLMRKVDENIARIASHTPTGATVEERLIELGIAVLREILLGDTVGLWRLVIAEAPRFPELASTVDTAARRRAADAIARLLGEVAHSDELGRFPAFSPERLPGTTRFFLDLIILPLLMRALLGEKLKTLHAEIAPHVARGVAFFLAACRHCRLD
jgi:AcrR family transcriptional regulator